MRVVARKTVVEEVSVPELEIDIEERGESITKPRSARSSSRN